MSVPLSTHPQRQPPGHPVVHQLIDLPIERDKQCHLWIILHETAAGRVPGLGQTQEFWFISAE